MRSALQRRKNVRSFANGPIDGGFGVARNIELDGGAGKIDISQHARQCLLVGWQAETVIANGSGEDQAEARCAIVQFMPRRGIGELEIGLIDAG